MFVVGNKQFSYAHIAVIELLENEVQAINPATKETDSWHGFSVRMMNDDVEQMLYQTKEERQEAWEALIDAMELAGY